MDIKPEQVVDEPVKKKRGRKKKSEIEALSNNTIVNEQPEEPTVKKRGRKPKGGKLITKNNSIDVNTNTVSNVILYLKCSMKDLINHNNELSNIVYDPLSYNPNAPPSVIGYNNNDNFSIYEQNNNISENTTEFNNKSDIILDNNICNLCKSNIKSDNENNNNIEKEEENISLKEINIKLKEIKLDLYKGNYPDKKVACFWCTYEYDNPSCYIPRYDMDNVTYGYGSFCRPECAAAFLMTENIDDSMKFERYHLLNQIYGKVYNYQKNIKPAPNPYYLLDKFYGNLSIQEYRKLLKSEHMLLVIDKPMTRILPELHEDNEDFTNNKYGNKPSQNNNVSGVYKVKRQSEKQKGPSKSDILRETFGL